MAWEEGRAAAPSRRQNALDTSSHTEYAGAEELAMNRMIRTADSRGRGRLPGFANATVIIEAVSDGEYRVRKAVAVLRDEKRFSEENMPVELSERDARKFLAALHEPPAPNAAL